MDTMQDYRDRLARRLECLPFPAADPGLHALAWALVGSLASESGACAWAQEALPGYVEAEMAGELDFTGDEQAAVRRHVLLCAECGRLYARSLQIAWLLARDELPHAPRRPSPRLPFGGDIS